MDPPTYPFEETSFMNCPLMESLRNTASLKKFEFLRQFCKALRKLDHVLL